MRSWQQVVRPKILGHDAANLVSIVNWLAVSYFGTALQETSGPMNDLDATILDFEEELIEIGK